MKKIMLIDDEKPVLNALQRFLTRAGWQVTAFSNPESALDYARSANFPLVISDYRMPAMDGVEFLYKLNQIQPNIYKIMLSGQADQEGVINAINQAGIHHFLNKPWNNEQLLSQLEKGIEQYKKRRSELFKLNKKTLSKQEYNARYEAMLEKSSPGITKVRRNAMGWIEVGDD